jgi:GxxExxY protein
MVLEHEALTGNIIAAAIEVHRRLGPGFIESVYENAFVLELKKRGIKANQQKEKHIN